MAGDGGSCAVAVWVQLGDHRGKWQSPIPLWGPTVSEGTLRVCRRSRTRGANSTADAIAVTAPSAPGEARGALVGATLAAATKRPEVAGEGSPAEAAPELSGRSKAMAGARRSSLGVLDELATGPEGPVLAGELRRLTWVTTVPQRPSLQRAPHPQLLSLTCAARCGGSWH